MNTNQEKIEEVGEVVLRILDEKDATFPELKDRLKISDVKATSYDLSLALKELLEKSSILHRINKGELYQHSPDGIFEELEAHARRLSHKLYDIFLREMPIKRTIVGPILYKKDEFPPYLMCCTLTRDRWYVETDDAWKGVIGRKTTQNGDRTLIFNVNSDDTKDRVELVVEFQRERFREWRVPILANVAYAISVLNDFSEIHRRGKKIKSFANLLADKTGWNSYEVAEFIDGLSTMESSRVSSNYRALAYSMFNEFFDGLYTYDQVYSRRTDEHWQKHMELLHYLQVKTNEIRKR